MQKWEYLVIRGFGGKALTTNYPTATYITSQGLKIEKISSGGGKKEMDDVAKFITQLGEKGWELVSAVMPHDYAYESLYFKRPKE